MQFTFSLKMLIMREKSSHVHPNVCNQIVVLVVTQCRLEMNTTVSEEHTSTFNVKVFRLQSVTTRKNTISRINAVKTQNLYRYRPAHTITILHYLHIQLNKRHTRYYVLNEHANWICNDPA
jgi:hypothetical protein